jgi:6-phosphogluconolactonase
VVEVVICADAQSMAASAAGLAIDTIADALAVRGRVLVALSGGRTPRELYRLLAIGMQRERIPVDRMLWIFADERWVPVSHPDSNEGMSRRILLEAIGAPEATILSWHAGSGNPVERGSRYADEIRDAAGPDDAPDLSILGIGADGHTASLFPGAFLKLPGGSSLPVGRDVPPKSSAVLAEPAGWRLTLCPRYLNTSRTVLFAAEGPEKRESLRRAWRESPDIPASWIRGCDTIFMTTRETLGDAPPDYGGNVRFA